MDEVEELLKAAEDEMVLKLKVDSHISRSSPSYLEPDLEHRFQALKKPPPSSSSSKTNRPISNSQLPQPSPQRTITDAKSVQSFQDDDDLYARFAALKGISSSSSSIPPTRSDSGGVQIDHSNGKKNNDEDDVDEVEKIIQWAIDAARLDPSPPTDDEDQEDDDDSEDDDDEEELDDRVKGNKKGKKV